MSRMHAIAPARFISAIVILQALTAAPIAGSPARAFSRVMPPGLPAPIAADNITRVLMRNVNFYVDPNIVLHIRELRGTMRSKVGGPVVFDDKYSFIFHINSAEVGLDGSDLAVLMNKYIFAYRGAPIKKVVVTISGGEMRMTGVLHKGVDIPFEIRAQVDATSDGMMRIHPTRTKIFHLNGDGLMRVFHLSLEKLIDVSKAIGVTVHGDDIVIDPVRVLPPPIIEGHIMKVRVQGDQVVQTFGAHITRCECEELHVLPRRFTALRSVDDAERRHADRGSEPIRPVRV